MSIEQFSDDSAVPAVKATNRADGGFGVLGVCAHGHGVRGESTGSKGVVGMSSAFEGVYGHSDTSAGVVGESTAWVGVYGKSASPDAGAGVMGEGASGPGVLGTSKTGAGVVAGSESGEALHAQTNSPSAAAVAAVNTQSGPGVLGVSEQFDGVVGTAKGPGKAGIAGRNEAGIGVYGSGAVAARFEGDVEVTGDIRLVNADCAEQFDVVTGSLVEPGTVVVFADDGRLRPSHEAYDKRVAGVVSGAGDFRPALTLDARPSSHARMPVALMGKVFCRVDADHDPIEVGDLLTTSASEGRAMKASEPALAFGAVIGKALRSLSSGVGLIPILVTRQ